MSDSLDDLRNAHSEDAVVSVLISIVAKATGAEQVRVFLYDPHREELYARTTNGAVAFELRFSCALGLTGTVFKSGVAALVNACRGDPQFVADSDAPDQAIPRCALYAPLRVPGRPPIGVIQCFNKRTGPFSPTNLEALEVVCAEGASVLVGHRPTDHAACGPRASARFDGIERRIEAENAVDSLLRNEIAAAAQCVNAERATLFLSDTNSGELWSRVSVGAESQTLRVPLDMGIAGHVFTTGNTVAIPHAYADFRFDPSIDEQYGEFTRSVICVPVINARGEIIGVVEAVNKIDGSFCEEDADKLRVAAKQVALVLANADLLDDGHESRGEGRRSLLAVCNGVITLDGEGRVVTCNAAARRLLNPERTDITGVSADALFTGANSWINERIQWVADNMTVDISVDANLHCARTTVSVTVTVLPLMNADDIRIGTLVLIEDLTGENRVKSAIAKYIQPGLVGPLLEGNEDVLAARNIVATLLFSDIRGFTPLSQKLGPQGAVNLLNEYFTLMLDCLRRSGDTLDKFIGDALMSAFGIAVTRDDDADRAVLTAIDMIRALESWNQRRRDQELDVIDIGIGLNTDKVVCGTIGSPAQREYTVIGDGVNLASRLEGACKVYHAKILISENTRAHLKTPVCLRSVDRVMIPGRHQTIDIFEVLDHHTDKTFPNIETVLQHFEEGIANYRAAHFARAEKAFRKAFDANPSDYLVSLYVDRCRALIESPPSPDWSDVSMLTRA